MGISPGVTIQNGSAMMQALGRFAGRLFQAPNDTIRGISPNAWYSPLQPVEPIAPEGTEARGFQYWAGQNLLWTPRADADWSAADLKQLAIYPLARMCIDNVKDTLCQIPWEIQPRRQPGETKKQAVKRGLKDDKLIKLNRFFEYPDRLNNWADWLRPLLEDMLVIDAASILIRKTFNGDVVEMPVIRGEMITRYIDVNGFTPLPPSPAYAQNWWGVPMVNLTTDQLIYRPRNIVPRNTMSSQIYGCAPTEGGATELQIGIQRLAFQLAYYCYSNDTEVLTKRGWLKFSEANVQDEFATREIQTGIFEWQKAYDTFYKHYEGEMVHFKGQSLDLLVTPNHRMLVDSLPRGLGMGKPLRKKEFVIEADALAEVHTNNTGIPQWSVWRGLEIKEKIFSASRKRSGPAAMEVRMSGDQYCAFMGMYLAEGSIRRQSVQIAQPKDKRGAHKLYCGLLTEILGTKPCFAGHQFEFQRSALADFLKPFGHAHQKFIPDDIRETTPRQLEIFWKYYWMGDGTASGTPQVFTVSKRLADQLTEIIQKMGDASTTWIREPGIAKLPEGRVSKSRIGWMVTRRKGTNATGWSAKRESYSGPVCCVCVPNKFLYVRRNGKAAWSGNTEGSIPGVVQVVPRGTNPDKIAEAMAWMNSELAGNLAARRQWRLVQGFNEPGKPDQIEFTKEPLLTDMFDELHIRKVCFMYGSSPQRLMRMMNRASAQASQDASEIEGLLPYIRWVKGVLDHIIQRTMGYSNYEMVFDPSNEADPATQATTLKELAGSGMITKNEARERLGEEESSDPMADVLGLDTGTGFVPLGHVVEQAQIAQQNTEKQQKQLTAGGSNGSAANPKPGQGGQAGGGAPGGGGGGKPNGKPKPNGKVAGEPSVPVTRAQATAVIGFQAPETQTGHLTFSKAERPVIHPGRLQPESVKAKHKLERILIDHFAEMKRIAKRELRKQLLKLEKVRKFDSIQFNLDPDDRARVCGAIAWDSEDLTAKGIETDPHVTVLFGLDGATHEQIEAITKGTGDIPVTLGELEIFDGKDETQQALVIRIESEKLTALHNALAALPHTDTHPEYKPHICLAYLNAGTAAKYEAEGNPLKGMKITLSDLVFSRRDKTMVPLAKAAESATTKEILKQLAAEWRKVAQEALEPFEGATLAGVDNAVIQLDISDAGMLGEMNQMAKDWAHDRAAEMVGMKWNRAGRLVQNPDARWAISDKTREGLRDVISELFDEGGSTFTEIEDAIMDAGIFSDTRATMIARTEISRAQVQSNLNAWRDSGLVKMVDWQMSSLHDQDDECDALEDGSPYPIDAVPDFPAHPFCMCTLVISEQT